METRDANRLVRMYGPSYMLYTAARYTRTGVSDGVHT
jgi:hypothetical protein